MVETPFDIYVRFYGMVQSGTKLSQSDYIGYNEDGDNVEFDESKRLAASLAAQDVKANKSLKSKSHFLQELKDLQS